MNYVYVLNKDGEPIMPTKRHNKVAYLLKHNLAYVVKRTPFTIRLNYVSKEYKQEINLGVDAGYKNIGVSATTKNSVLFESEVKLREDVVDNIYVRKENRWARRSRKTRYRAERFNNRVSSKKNGWLPPSIKHVIDCHKTIIKQVHDILPISKIIVETAQFDVQKIKNPDICGEQYCHGEQFNFWNVREYVLFRDNHICQCCHGKSKDKILNVHHIESRKTGGNAPNNLITLCETCHKDYHAGKISLNLKRNRSFKSEASMTIMKPSLLKYLFNSYPHVLETYGYITKNIRIKYNLPKEHYIDARCISGNPTAKNEFKDLYKLVKNRKHNRQIHKGTIYKGGVRRLNQAPYILFNFRLNDKVKVNNEICFVHGRRSRGNFTIKNIDGKLVKDGIIYKKLKLIEKAKSYRIDRVKGIA